MSWLVAFGLTLLFELPVVAWILRDSAGLGKILLVGLFANLVTHPVVWFVLPRFFTSYIVYLFTAELGATAIEAVVFWALLRPQPGRLALSASAFANAASLGLGLVAYQFGWM